MKTAFGRGAKVVLACALAFGIAHAARAVKERYVGRTMPVAKDILALQGKVRALKPPTDRAKVVRAFAGVFHGRFAASDGHPGENCEVYSLPAIGPYSGCLVVRLSSGGVVQDYKVVYDGNEKKTD